MFVNCNFISRNKVYLCEFTFHLSMKILVMPRIILDYLLVSSILHSENFNNPYPFWNDATFVCNFFGEIKNLGFNCERCLDILIFKHVQVIRVVTTNKNDLKFFGRYMKTALFTNLQYLIFWKKNFYKFFNKTDRFFVIGKRSLTCLTHNRWWTCKTRFYEDKEEVWFAGPLDPYEGVIVTSLIMGHMYQDECRRSLIPPLGFLEEFGYL